MLRKVEFKPECIKTKRHGTQLTALEVLVYHATISEPTP